MRKCGIRLRQRQQFIDAAYAPGGNNTELGKVAVEEAPFDAGTASVAAPVTSAAAL